MNGLYFSLSSNKELAIGILAMLKLSMFRSKFYIFLPLLISLHIFAQELDEAFLESLPSNIQNDFKKNYQLDQAETDKIISSPETRIKNLEQSLNEAKMTLKRIEEDLVLGENDTSELKRFGERFFNSFQSTFLPINEPNSHS